MFYFELNKTNFFKFFRP